MIIACIVQHTHTHTHTHTELRVPVLRCKDAVRQETVAHKLTMNHF